MNRILILLGAALAASCATGPAPAPAAGPAPARASAADDRIESMEARIIGLTAEIDRLARRVSRLEGGSSAAVDPGPAPAPEPSAGKWLPVPVMPSPEPSPEPAAAPAIEATGVLIDLRSMGDQVPSGRAWNRWRVTDAEGVTLFSHEDLSPEARAAGTTFWQAPAETVLGPQEIDPVGAKPFIGAVVEARFVTEGDVEEATFVLGRKSAEAARSVTDLRGHVAAGRIVILVREYR